MRVNCIYEGNCIEVMEKEIDKNSIDLIYADPPYNVSKKKLSLLNNKTGGPFIKMSEDWDQFSYEEYKDFTKKWLKKCWDVLKSNGSLYVSCNYHNIGEIIYIAKELGFKLNNIITWYKPNAMPSVIKRTFTHATEYVCWFVKGNGWKFNYKKLKELNPETTKAGNKKQMRDFINFITLPVVQGKERLKRADGRALHPTQKPEKLLEIIIEASSDKGDLVLDPFFGTGTTGVVANRLGRNWIGIEINPLYVKAAKKRLGI